LRGLLLLASIVAFLGVTFVRPFAGVLVWTWFTLMDPNDSVYGLARTLPLNLAIAAVTVLAWLLSSDRKRLPLNLTTVLVVTFLIWMTVNTFLAFNPPWAWPYWDRTWKIFALGILVAIMSTNRARFHALIWIATISLGFYAIKGGIFTLLTGGQNHVYGPAASIIGDNNQLALALLMTLPLMNYLRLHTESALIRYGLVATMALLLVAVLGTYSRGAIVTLVALAAVSWLRTKRKLVYAAIMFVLVGSVTTFEIMAPSFWLRVDTIQHPESDPSFIGRQQAWHVAFGYAIDHFPIGAGFNSPQHAEIFHKYEPDAVLHAAHSIYFQVLGELGFGGLAIYLAMFASSFVDLRRVIQDTKGKPDLLWAHDLARMAQLSLFAFAIGGAALSMAYYDLFVIIICMGVALRDHVHSFALANAPRLELQKA
jgi:probable O-glycosylation ligase (exosortase A-associated)